MICHQLNRKQKYLLLIPALWASVFDIAITITHQPKEYWNGDLNASNEGNPMGKFMMTSHVSGIFVISIVWLAVIVLLGYYLPMRIARIFLVFVLIAHSSAVSTWISPRYGFWAVIFLMIFNSVLFCVVDEWVSKDISLKITIQKL